MNAEKLVMDWLNAAPELKDYPASFEVPAKSSATSRIPFVTVERTGGSEGRFVSRPLIAVQVWGRFTLGRLRTWHSVSCCHG